METYTIDGKQKLSSPSAPLLIVGPSIAKVAPDAREAYAEARLQQTSHLKIGEVTERASLSVDGLPGYELLANAVEDSGAPLVIYQVLLFTEEHYFILQGLVGRDQASTYVPQFKKNARSFRRLPQRDER